MRSSRVTKILATLGVVIGMSIGLAPVANASTSQCTSGNACMWGENDYTGCFVQYTNNTAGFGNWATCAANANDGANSVRNSGNYSSAVFWADSGYTGSAIMFNRVGLGYNYQDPNLSNGGGVTYSGAGANTENWQDRISSLSWV
jgi:hypothetical protein